MARVRDITAELKAAPIILGLAVALLLCSSPSLAAQRPGTDAHDFGNSPRWSSYLNYERAILSPRAASAGDSLRAHGVKVYHLFQTLVHFWDSAPVTQWPVDRAVWETALRFNAIHTDSTTHAYVKFPDGAGYSCALDFSVAGFPEALADAVALAMPPNDGIMFDMGCHTNSWIPELYAIPGVDWQAWSNGYYRFRKRLRDNLLGVPQVGACSKWMSWVPSITDGVLLESVGPPANLTSFRGAWSMLQGKPLSMLLCQSPTLQHRRCLATMAMVVGCGFNWRPRFFQGDRTNVEDYEHFDLDLGVPYSSIIVLWNEGVYMRLYQRGWALLNLSYTTYSYQNYRVAPNDGLVVQTRDERGRWMPPRTNVGR